MKFKTYYTALTPQEKTELASNLKTSKAYLSQIAHGHRQAGFKFAVRIEEITSGLCPREDIRPDIYTPYKP